MASQVRTMGQPCIDMALLTCELWRKWLLGKRANLQPAVGRVSRLLTPTPNAPGALWRLRAHALCAAIAAPPAGSHLLQARSWRA